MERRWIEMKAYRHGDVILVKISEGEFKFNKQRGRKLNTNIVKEGEKAGHYHTLLGDVELFGSGNVKVCEVKKDTVIDHPEHGKGKVEKGYYKILSPVEWNYVKEEKRKVLD